MESVNAKVQTGIRLNPDLYHRLKMNAKRQNRSFNNYVERLLSSAAGLEYPNLGSLKVSEEIKSLGETLPHYTKEEISKDDRLAYLLSK